MHYVLTGDTPLGGSVRYGARPPEPTTPIPDSGPLSSRDGSPAALEVETRGTARHRASGEAAFDLALSEERELARPIAGTSTVPYRLPGKGDPSEHLDCQLPLILWHEAVGKDGKHEQHYRKEPARGCGSFDCPVNVNGSDDRWANRYMVRQAKLSARRLGRFVRHVIVSPPGPDWPSVKKGGRPCAPPPTPAEVRELKTRAYRALRRAFPGRKLRCDVVAHPERHVSRNRDCGVAGFHFHAAITYPGLGLFDGEGIRSHHAATGWVVKVLPKKRDTFSLMLYELHHAGRWLRPAPPYPAPDAKSGDTKSRYATEAVTQLGREPTDENEVPDGVKCRVCSVLVSSKDWHRGVWCGEPGSEPSESFGAVPVGPAPWRGFETPMIRCRRCDRAVVDWSFAAHDRRCAERAAQLRRARY